MKKKGFTLIELLAVIVILAIIALISVPMIFGIIGKAKKGALGSTANGLLESATLYYANNLEASSEDQIFLFDETYDGQTTEGETLSYKGDFTGTGSVRLYATGKTAICITDGTYYAIKNIGDTSVTTGEGTCEFDEATQSYLSIDLVSKDQLDALQANYDELQAAYDTLLAEKQLVITALTNKGIETTIDESLTQAAAQIDALAVGKQVVLLGTGAGTYDVSSYEGYESFTVDNFIVEGYQGTASAADFNRGVAASATISKTYNSTTGVLTVGNGFGSGNVDNSTISYIYAYAYSKSVYLVY